MVITSKMVITTLCVLLRWFHIIPVVLYTGTRMLYEDLHMLVIGVR